MFVTTRTPSSGARRLLVSRFPLASEEPSVLGILARYFSETEAEPALEAAKRAARGRIYATRYIEFGDKYFSQQQVQDARRCYVLAIRNSPSTLLRLDVVRRLLGTVIGLRSYEAIKRWMGAGSRSGGG